MIKIRVTRVPPETGLDGSDWKVYLFVLGFRSVRQPPAEVFGSSFSGPGIA